MKYVIEGYRPASFFRFFEELSAIPRGSGREEQVCRWLIEFAKRRGLEYYSDSLWNLLIKKPGKSGAEPVILQGHTDMVCEKNQDTQHDFLSQPLKLMVNDDILTAQGTTLGGDDGVGVALMLALLDDDSLELPPLECVFTAQEEVGLIGANGFDCSRLSGRRMINLDGEGSGVAIAGCAGGLRVKLRRASEYAPVTGFGMELMARGFKGGHSGGEIDSSRGNAIKETGRIITELERSCSARLIALEAGDKDNAIPREADALLTFDSEVDRENAAALVAELSAAIAAEYRANDPELRFDVRMLDTLPSTGLSVEVAHRLVQLICTAPHGVQFRDRAQGLLIASVNLASVHDVDGTLEICFSPRSSIASRKQEIASRLITLAELFGYSATLSAEYPGWAYNPDSQVRQLYSEACEKYLGRPATVEVTHGGLECGIFCDRLPGLDVISIGAECGDIHTPEEWLKLSSCSTLWDIVVYMLTKMAGEEAK